MPEKIKRNNNGKRKNTEKWRENIVEVQRAEVSQTTALQSNPKLISDRFYTITYTF